MRDDDFEELFETTFSKLYGYLARRVGPDIGRDLTSETFARALEVRGRYDPARADTLPWLFGIATNVLRRHYRDEERRLRALARLPGESATTDAPPEEPLLAEALRSLPGTERDVLLLFAWADLSYEQIAEALSVPLGTVRSRLHRARAHVRAALQQMEAVDG